MAAWSAAVVLSGCATSQPRMVVPEHLRASPAANADEGQASKPAQKNEGAYQLRIVDQGRSYDVQFPPVTGGYELRLPLPKKGKSPLPALVDPTEKPIPRDGPGFRERLVEIRSHFARGQLDVAQVELNRLLAMYPNDPELLAMQGSLAWQQGDRDLARDIWRRVLEMDPSNVAVQRMLEGIP